MYAKTVATYVPGLNEEQVHTTYTSSDEFRERITKASEAIDDRIADIRHGLRTEMPEDIRPLGLNEKQAQRLRETIQQDSQWQHAYNDLLRITIRPDYTITEKSIRSMNTPWWNQAVLTIEGVAYDKTKLDVNCHITHSYNTQLAHHTLDALSDQSIPATVCASLITADDKQVLGLRKGHRYSNSISNVANGSLEYCRGKNPLFETFYLEAEEELALHPNDFRSVELIGSFIDWAFNPRVYNVMRARTNLTFAELNERWKNAADGLEHDHLLAFNDDPEQMISHIERIGFDLDRIVELLGLEGTAEGRALALAQMRKKSPLPQMLSQCAMSILQHYAQDAAVHSRAYADIWSRETEERLGNRYKIIDDPALRTFTAKELLASIPR